MIVNVPRRAGVGVLSALTVLGAASCSDGRGPVGLSAPSSTSAPAVPSVSAASSVTVGSATVSSGIAASSSGQPSGGTPATAQDTSALTGLAVFVQRAEAMDAHLSRMEHLVAVDSPARPFSAEVTREVKALGVEETQVARAVPAGLGSSLRLATYRVLDGLANRAGVFLDISQAAGTPSSQRVRTCVDASARNRARFPGDLTALRNLARGMPAPHLVTPSSPVAAEPEIMAQYFHEQHHEKAVKEPCDSTYNELPIFNWKSLKDNREIADSLGNGLFFKGTYHVDSGWAITVWYSE